MPWTTLKVMADGRVLPCCDSGRLAVGNVTTSSIADILDGERHRAVRASILAGRPTVRCRGCSWAERGSFEEFARDIRVWQGGPGSQARHDAEVERTIWPGLFSQDGHAVVLENAELQPGEGGAARLIERMRHGLHRVLVEIEPRTATDISLVARPAGRRRLRFDLAHGGEMIARANIILSARPTADVVLGDLDCRVSKRGDGGFEISASLRGARTVSNINIELAREDAAVIYAGDGRSGLIISNLRVAQ